MDDESVNEGEGLIFGEAEASLLEYSV